MPTLAELKENRKNGNCSYIDINEQIARLEEMDGKVVCVGTAQFPETVGKYIGGQWHKTGEKDVEYKAEIRWSNNFNDRYGLPFLVILPDKNAGDNFDTLSKAKRYASRCFGRKLKWSKN